MSEGDTLSYAEARDLVAQARDDRRVIQIQNIGATVYLRYCPYVNGHGVTIHQWLPITITGEVMPGSTLLMVPRIVYPWQSDTWEINQIFDAWVVNYLAHRRHGEIDTPPVDETPFAGGLLLWGDGDD